MVDISMLVDNTKIVMSSCSHCDTRYWRRDGELVELDGVLEDIRESPTRYRRALTKH